MHTSPGAAAWTRTCLSQGGWPALVTELFAERARSLSHALIGVALGVIDVCAIRSALPLRQVGRPG